jgi:hypothetical protein
VTNTVNWTVLLSGIVGSHAYGLALPHSDVDTLAVAAAPTSEFHGLHLPVDRAATHVTTSPDSVVHEARRYVTLCLAANPTVTELLWLPEDCYVVQHPLGRDLLEIRGRLLGAKRVRDAYLGYAYSQFKRLCSRGTTFSSDTRTRVEKHARHLLRLIDGGVQLYTTGHLDVRLADPERYHAFGRYVVDDTEAALSHASNLLDAAYTKLDRESSPLPETPDYAAADEWLRSVRRRLLQA